ncbi:hypothetical protein COR16_06355 [Campylobacter upsaliensis]|nr:hypothetical protein [Campylobacter upsaliensis]EAJ5220876.1 hypothetical protein [Campylobacter upsaliensis]EFV1646680.1 hypothetical protein [Campylobacter upsaliensis]EKM9250449.1 hypothetical protein [Campylobacter upsaliensis]ELJ8893622.1 hypothetical protein [Campylobacter upsaliensis]
MTKDLRKMILKAYKSLDSLGVSLHKNFYYTLGVYALEFFENEWESYALGSESLYIDKEEKILYEAFFHTLFLNNASLFHYRGKKQGFYGKYYFVKKYGLLEFY